MNIKGNSHEIPILHLKAETPFGLVFNETRFNFSSTYFSSAVANVSFQNFAPGFIARFIESHAVMLQGNAGLKPKEGEYTSRPWEWPINLRVSKQGYT